MFSNIQKKKMSKFLISIALSSSFVGCSDYLSGVKPKPEVIALNSMKLQCLEKIPSQIKDFSEGSIDESGVNSGIVCLQDALTYFKERTDGSVAGGYTIQDMRSFFGKYFLKENNVSPELASDLMRLKQVLLGGSDEFISKEEMNRLVSILGEFRKEILLIRPHVKTLVFKDSQVSDVELKESVRVLKSSLKKFISKTEIAKSGYTVNEAKSLFSGMADFITGDQPFNLYLKASNLIPVLESVKVIFLGSDAKLVSASDWNNAIDIGVDLYQLFLKTSRQNKFEIQSEVLPERINYLTESAELLLNLLEKSPRLRKEGIILFSDIDSVISEINSRKWLPIDVSDRALSEAYRAVVQKMLQPGLKSGLSSGYGIELRHIKALQQELANFKLVQDNLTKVVKEDSFNRSALSLKLKNINIDSHLRDQKIGDVASQKIMKQHWEFFVKQFTLAKPLHFDSVGRVTINYFSEQNLYNIANLTRFNVMFTLSRFLMLGYSDQLSDNYAGLALLNSDPNSPNGLTRWYDDSNTIGEELKAFDPRSKSSGNRSFQEASFFTPSGDGDLRLNPQEVFEFVSYLFSGGLGSTDLIVTQVKADKCETPGTVDIFGYTKFNEVCLKKSLKNHFSQLFKNLPSLSLWASGLSSKDWDDFYFNIMSVSRVSNPREGLVEVADLRTAVMILHYTETIFIQYDQNKDQVLDANEIKLASKRFLTFLRGIKPGVSDYNLAAGFVHLVTAGEMPSTLDVVATRARDLIGDSRLASRADILRVFGILKDNLK